LLKGEHLPAKELLRLKEIESQTVLILPDRPLMAFPVPFSDLISVVFLVLFSSFFLTGLLRAINPHLVTKEQVKEEDVQSHVAELASQAILGSETNQRPVPYPHENVVFHVAQLQAEALRKQGAKKHAGKPYEVVTTLRQAEEKTGVPQDEILMTRDIEAEYHINKKLVHEYTRRGREGRPHLTPLSVRLAGGGGGQLLFRREDIERLVANPPKPGPLRK
jgi:hypothetical protein